MATSAVYSNRYRVHGRSPIPDVGFSYTDGAVAFSVDNCTAIAVNVRVHHERVY